MIRHTHALTLIVLLGSAGAVACASFLTSRDKTALTSYLTKATDRLESCMAQVRGKLSLSDPSSTSDPVTRNDMCGTDAEAELQPFYLNALRAVRYERGTTLHVKLYHDHWTAIMRRLGQKDTPQWVRRDGDLHDEIERLKQIAVKLDP